MKHQVLRWSSCPSSRSLTRLLTLLIIFFGLSVSCITHVDAQVGLSQLYHRSWTPRDGAPDNIETLIQGPDGFLWLVADTGLFRFDGVSFFPYTPASGSSLLHKQVTSIHATRDGSLWLPYFDGGMARVQNGSVRNYTERDGLIPNNPINSLVQDRQGTVWAGGLKGLEKIKDAQVTTVGPEAGLTGGSIACLALDKEDNLWAVQQQKIMVLPRGSKTFVFAMAWSGYRDAGCKDGRKGGVWLWGKNKPIISAAFSDGQVTRHVVTRAIEMPWSLMEASDGALWIGTRANGILRFYPASEKIVQGETARIESENEHNGLTANFAFESVEDAEGSVWVATTKGLDQFRPVPFRAMDVGQTAPIVLPQGEPGSSFMISSDHVVDLTTGKPVSLKLGKPEWTRSLYRSSDGVLWIGTVGHLWRYVGGRFARQALPREVTNSVPPPVLAVLEDTDHGIWVSLGSGFGLFRWDSGRWVKGGGYPALLGGIVMATERDANGALWFGYRDGRVARLSGGQVDFFGKLEGLDLGVINVFAKHGGELWVAGEEGVALWRQDRFYPVHLADQYVLQGITGAAFTADGSLWINQLTGVFRIDSAELDRWRSQPGYAVKCNVFDSHDGLRGVPHPIVGLGSAKSAPDGRLYVATRTNLQWIDPLHLPHNGVLPQVWITGWKTDRANGSWPSAALNLEPRASNLEIDYVATSLLIPERVRFRYKLEGFDDGWVDASSRRQAFYPKLPPGHYTFKVIACNDSGVWNNGGASFIFAIPPTFIQTIWFKILCVIVLACMVTFAYILRMRHVATQIRRGMYERMAEREDIARNLHDTFFQNVQGLLLRFNTATSKLSSDEPARELLQDTLKQSDQVMLEGRRLLVGLHDQAPQHVDLHTALAEYGRELQKSYGVALDVVVNGSVHALHPVVLEEVLNVGREALSNSFRHSKGRSIEAEITYEPKVLRMRVRDDGTGVDSHILKQGHREGHLGFPGMRERAKKIGARLDIWSREGMGTEIELSVNSAIAYVAEESVEKKRRPHRAS